MESEGPYRIRKGFNYGVVGPGIPNTEEEYDLTPDIANMIYAEGRKAAEKDFKEAIGWADSICLDWNYSKDYKKWKKARGIE